MATLAEQVAHLWAEIANLEERERAMPAHDRAGRMAIDGRIKATTELLTALVSLQGEGRNPWFPFFLVPVLTVFPVPTRPSLSQRQHTPCVCVLVPFCPYLQLEQVGVGWVPFR